MGVDGLKDRSTKPHKISSKIPSDIVQTHVLLPQRKVQLENVQRTRGIPKRYSKALPGERVRVDVKFLNDLDIGHRKTRVRSPRRTGKWKEAIGPTKRSFTPSTALFPFSAVCSFLKNGKQSTWMSLRKYTGWEENWRENNSLFRRIFS